MAPTPAAAVEAKKPGFKSVLVEIGLVTVIAAAIGGIFAFARPPAAPSRATQAEEKPAPAPVRPQVIDLPPIVSNLASPQDVWARIEISIVFEGTAVRNPEVEAARIGADALAYLRTLTLAQLEGAVGLQNLRQDLNERARIRAGNSVRELVLRTLVVQ